MQKAIFTLKSKIIFRLWTTGRQMSNNRTLRPAWNETPELRACHVSENPPGLPGAKVFYTKLKLESFWPSDYNLRWIKIKKKDTYNF